MREYLQRHEAFIRRALSGEPASASWTELRDFPDRQIAFLQHERLVHLLVTLFVCLFALLAMGFAYFVPQGMVLILALGLLGLSAAYLLHYFRLENGVQRLYHLRNEIDLRLGVVGARYEAKDGGTADG